MNKPLILGVVSRAAVRGLFALVLIVAASTALPARAAPLPGNNLVLDLTPGGSNVTCACGSVGVTMGWAFTVDAPITVDGIGVWTAFQHHGRLINEAGLWTATGTLLRSAAFTISSGTRVGSANPAGQWRFESFAPLTLSVGDYVIGSVLTGAGPSFQDDSPFVTIPEITVTGGVRGPTEAGFAAPLIPFSSTRFTSTLELAVPEPATLGLMALGLLGVGFAGRKRRN